MKPFLIVLFLVGAGFGLYKHLSPAGTAPDLTFEDSAGQQVGWTELREGKQHLLAVFLLPGCSMSDFSAELVSEVHAQHGDSIAFVGLAFGTAPAADSYRRNHGLDFTVVGLKSATDPYAAQEFFDKVRKAYGSYSGIYGGTVVLLDRQNEMLFGLAKEEVRELPGRLALL